MIKGMQVYGCKKISGLAWRLGYVITIAQLGVLIMPSLAHANENKATNQCYSDTYQAYQALLKTQKSPKTAVININRASIAELVSLTGIGHQTAQAIVAYRDKHGSFASVDELMQIKGVGAATVNKNRHRLSVLD